MASPASTTLIGSYLFKAPLELNDPGLSRLNASRVSHAKTGQPAVAFRTSLAQMNATDVADVRTRLERLTSCQTPGVARVVEAGISGAIAFSITEPPAGNRLCEELAAGRQFTPFETVNLVRNIASCVERTGMAHGQISSALIWIADSGAPSIGGFSFVEPNPNADGAGLAALAFELLSGIRFDAARFDFNHSARNDRVREALPGVTAQFAGAISNGLFGARPSVADFVLGLEAAASGSASDLATAAQDAVSAKDLTSAHLFLDLGLRYDPENAELAAVRFRMGSGETAERRETPTVFVVPPESIDDETYDPASEQAKFLAALKASIPEPKTSKPKLPWLAIAAGLIGMFAIVGVLGFIVIQAN